MGGIGGSELAEKGFGLDECLTTTHETSKATAFECRDNSGHSLRKLSKSHLLGPDHSYS